MKKYIFKDDGINGIKVQSYDYEVVEGEEKKTSKSNTIRVMPDTDFMVLNNTDNSEESVFVPMAQEIKDFAKKCFTAKVKKEYKARKDAEKVEADKAQAKEDAKPKLFTGNLKIGTQTFFIENGLIKVK